MNLKQQIEKFEEEVGIKIESYTVNNFAVVGSILRIRGGNYMLCQVSMGRLKLITLDVDERGNRYVDTEFEGVYKKGPARFQYGIYIDTLRGAGIPAEICHAQRMIILEGSR